MLTENELKWLKDRPWYPDHETFKTMPRFQQSRVNKICRDWLERYNAKYGSVWALVNYTLTTDDQHLLEDAAEFEARVAVDVAYRYNIPTNCRVCPINKSNFCQDKFKKRFGFACWTEHGSAWLLLKIARLKIEGEMDYAD